MNFQSTDEDLFSILDESSSILAFDKKREIIESFSDIPIRIKNKFYKKNYFDEKSLIDDIKKCYINNKSSFIFPSEWVEYYPQLRETTLKKLITCNISGAVLKPGEDIVIYYGFMERLKSGKCYVTDKIVASSDYYSIFPKTFFEYEDWYNRITSAYFNQENNGIDFYQLSCEKGNNCLNPRLLNKKRP